MFGWILLLGVLIALGGSITLAAQCQLAVRHRLPPVKPAHVGLTYEAVKFRVRGEPLMIGAWHIPAAGAAQAVIIAHNSGSWRGRELTSSSLDLAADLIGSGFTVLMLDLHDQSASDSARTIYGMRERRELLGAVDWLLARGYAPGTIGVLCASISAVAGIGAANQELAIGALLLDSACADVLATLLRPLRRFSKLPLYFLPDGRLLAGNDLASQRPAELLRMIDRRPVQIIHARGAQLVPVEHSRALVGVAGEAELWVAHCASHLGTFGANPQVYQQQVTRFFYRALADRQIAAAADAEAYASTWRPRIKNNIYPSHPQR